MMASVDGILHGARGEQRNEDLRLCVLAPPAPRAVVLDNHAAGQERFQFLRRTYSSLLDTRFGNVFDYLYLAGLRHSLPRPTSDLRLHLRP